MIIARKGKKHRTVPFSGSLKEQAFQFFSNQTMPRSLHDIMFSVLRHDWKKAEQSIKNDFVAGLHVKGSQFVINN